MLRIFLPVGGAAPGNSAMFLARHFAPVRLFTMEIYMAGIRGAKNPFPVKTEKVSGLFKQRANGPAGNSQAVSYAKGGKRLGPVGRDNKLPSNTNSVRSNPTLKKGTSERSK